MHFIDLLLNICAEFVSVLLPWALRYKPEVAGSIPDGVTGIIH